MRASVTKKFKFEAAHRITNTEAKCRNLHGHTFRLEVVVGGEIDESSNMVIMSNDVKKIVHEKVINIVDHSCFNDTFEWNPTGENIAMWIWKQLENAFPGKCTLDKIVLYMTDTTIITLER